MAYEPYSMVDVERSSSRALFSVVSTFAGCGGSSIGYRLAGGRVLAFNEFLEVPRSVYSANAAPETIAFDQDIRELDARTILDACGIGIGELDVLDGSPPCTAFSTARGGRGENPFGREHDYVGRPQRVDDLFFEYARLIRDLRPRAFVAENVKGLLRGQARRLLGLTRDGRVILRKGRRTILSTLARCGYRVHWRVLDASAYGTPQARERLIFVGIRSDVDRRFEWPRPSTHRVTLGEGLVDLEQDEDQRLWLMANAIGSKVGALMAAFPKDPPAIIDGTRFMRSGSYFNMRRCSMDRPCATIGRLNMLARMAGPIHPTEDRKFTIPEIKRIMAFPDDFDLLDDRLTYDDQTACLGRAVPPRLIEAVATALHRSVLGPEGGGRR